MTEKISDHIFRQYDIRGRFGVDLTIGVADALARAYAIYNRRKTGIERPKVTVGRDVRLSSGALRDAIIEGLASSGVDCVDLGECPTPLQYFSMHTMDVDGGIMITGSHNPPEYNGFKISVGKETIHGEEIQELKDIINSEVLGRPLPDREKGNVEDFDIISRYIDFHAGNFKIEVKRPVKVVIDAGNGTAGPVAPALLRRIGCEVTELFCEPDGRFPNHHPDPTVPENLTSLIERVKDEGADFGVAYDGDADRIGVVDEKGEIVWGDQLMVIFARDIVASNPGATIVGEVKCSQVMYDEIERIGGRAVMWKTGHSLIKSRMKELGAAMAGEMSGHIFFADRYFGFDDAIYASLRLVEILARKRRLEPGTSFSSLLSGLPSTIVTPEIRIDCSDEKKFEVIERLRDAVDRERDKQGIKKIVTIDGLRIIFDGGWALVRASNTQPVLVLRFEARNTELLERYKDFIRKRLADLHPGCVIP